MLFKANKFSMKLSCSLFVCGSSFFSRFKIAKDYLLFVPSYASDPSPFKAFGVYEANPFYSGFVIAVWSSIAEIIRRCRQSEIVNRIIGRVMIDVIDFMRRPFPFDEQPHKAMSEIFTAIDADFYMTACNRMSGDSSDEFCVYMCRNGRARLPTENTRNRVTLKNCPEIILGEVSLGVFMGHTPC